MITITVNILTDDEKNLFLNTLIDEQRVQKQFWKCKQTKEGKKFFRSITRKTGAKTVTMMDMNTYIKPRARVLIVGYLTHRK